MREGPNSCCGSGMMSAAAAISNALMACVPRWARLVPGPGSGPWRAEDVAVQKMVMNVGRRPTVNVGDEPASVEVHVMHAYSHDFYGQARISTFVWPTWIARLRHLCTCLFRVAQEMRVKVLGYIRPEMRFAGGLMQLIDRIKTDIAVARIQLDSEASRAAAQDSFLLKGA